MVNDTVPLMREHSSNTPPYTDPPSYDSATGNGNVLEHSKSQSPKSHAPAPSPDGYAAMSSSVPYGSPPVMVYHYQHPITGDTITTPFPPDHPEMICLQEGRHITHSKFGFWGILAAIVWFPLGIGLCLLDRRVVCSRCGQVIDDGFSC